MAKSRSKGSSSPDSPVIENRRARHEYIITDTLECGMVLVGTEVKSLRHGQASLAEGFVRVDDAGATLNLYQVTIPEYPPAGARQHVPTRKRRLLAHASEIRRLAKAIDQKGMTIVPLKIYFKDGVAKVLIGVARGKGQADKRADIAKRDMQRDIQRALSRRM